ncbi:MAG: thioredoxin family protein [Planctomycetia bacterium]|nr:thioredoxin family protein [Planctomycetia bacterium]
MNRVLAGLALLILPGIADAQPRKTDPAKYGWHTDYSAARAEAKRTGKPMMLVFRCEP